MTASARDLRICFVGDSFVNGAGDPAFRGWTGRLCALPPARAQAFTAYNLGVRRETSGDILARLGEVARRLAPEHDGRVVFSFGANDTALADGQPRVALDQTVANLRAMLAAAQGRWPVLVVGPPALADEAHNARIDALCQQLAVVCAEHAVPYLPVYARLAASRVWRREVAAGDGAHPAAAGYQRLAGLVAAWPAWQAWFESA